MSKLCFGEEPSIWQLSNSGEWQPERVATFIAYLNHHRQRIVNYDYFKAEGIPIGSGAIESDGQADWRTNQTLRRSVERRKRPASALAPLRLSQWTVLKLKLARLGCTRPNSMQVVYL